MTLTKNEIQHIGTRALLTIALAASRLEVARTELYYFVVGLEAALAQRSLNNIDRRQMAKVRASCIGSFGYNAKRWDQ